MAGFGSLYSGIGLAQGLGGMSQAYAQGQQAAQQLAMQKMQQENLGLTRERTLAQMKDEQQLRERLSELSGLGSDLRTALQGTDEEVDQTALKTPSEQMAGSDLFKNTKPSLDLSGKPVNLGAMGSPLTGTPYETKKKKVNTIDYDKVADLKNRMAMGYQQAALLDPRYAALGEKAIQGIDEGILKRTFAAGVTGDVNTLSKGLKALTGQEFEITKDGDSFSVKGEGDLVPMKIKLEELALLTDPIKFSEYKRKYNEAQEKAAQKRLQFQQTEQVRQNRELMKSAQYLYKDKQTGQHYAVLNPFEIPDLEAAGYEVFVNPIYTLAQTKSDLKIKQDAAKQKGKDAGFEKLLDELGIKVK